MHHGGMRHLFAAFAVAAVALVGLAPPAVKAQPTPPASPAHGIAMHGAPALPPDFVSLPQVNPDAPKGGRLILGETGGFDSLNPFILRGRAPWAVSTLTVETLLGRAWDEPFTLYGWLAESVSTDSARTHVEFTLREQARFADGSPVTVEDVIWSFETLGTKGTPRYHAAWRRIAAITRTGPRSVRFDFTEPDRELPLILGLRPVPFRKRSDWWAADLPLMRGQHNFDEIRIEYFGDETALFEAFKAGEIMLFREGSASRWATGYDFARLRSGEVVRAEIPHGRPSGMFGIAMNTRRAPLDDIRVRQALIEALGFDFVNATLNAGLEARIESYFGGSDLAMSRGPADAAVAALLAPHAGSLPADTLEDLSLPRGDGTEANRAALRRAAGLLDAAGLTVRDGRRVDVAGRPIQLELLLPQGAAELRALGNLYAAMLGRLGIGLRITAVDSAQYVARTNAYDFDLTPMTRAMSLSPGIEQRLYWGRLGVTEPGTRNWPGVDSPAVEAMIDLLLTAEDPATFRTAARALDRALMAGRYVIPLWHSPVSRIAHDRRLRYPADRLPVYGDAQGFMPEIWWFEP
ncbi:MAG: extracellular solute-binding protein [Gemmobacter sp.]